MSVNWNPGNSRSWCSLNGGSTPATDKGIIIVTDDSSENLTTFFKSELDSLLEDQVAFLLIPNADEVGGILTSLRHAFIELIPEIDAEQLHSKMPISWVPTIKRLDLELATQRSLLVDTLDKILDASKRERRAFIRVLEQFSALPNCSVVAAVTNESALPIARLMGLVEPSPNSKRAMESHHTRNQNRSGWEIARFKAVDSSEEFKELKASKRSGKSRSAGIAIGLAAAFAVAIGAAFSVKTFQERKNTESFEVTFAPSPGIHQLPSALASVAIATDAEIVEKPNVASAPVEKIEFAPAPLPENQPDTPSAAIELIPENYDSISGSAVKVLPPAIIRPLEIAAQAPEPKEVNPPEKIDDINVTARNGEVDFNPGVGTPETDVLYFVAETHFFGHGMKEDPEKGLDLLEKAARKGSEKAANLLGTCYSVGKNVDQDYATAHRFYDRAIELGSIHAFGNLGVLYLKGQGCDQDPIRARSLFLKGASLGDPVSTFYAARCMERGIGAPSEDPEKARDYYIAAATLGNQGAIAWCKEKGILLTNELPVVN